MFGTHSRVPNFCLSDFWVVRRGHLLQGDELTVKTHALTPLSVQTVVSIHNQRGSHAKRWDNTGVVVESLDNSQ